MVPDFEPPALPRSRGSRLGATGRRHLFMNFYTSKGKSVWTHAPSCAVPQPSLPSRGLGRVDRFPWLG